MIRFGIAAAAAVLLAPAGQAAAGNGCVIERSDLPVTMEGRRAMIAAKVNGTDTAFMLDSGAFYSMMSPASAERLGLHTVMAAFGAYVTGVGGAADVAIATVRELVIAGVPVRNIQFLVGGSESAGAGVIGQNILRIADVEYDLAHGLVRFVRAKGCGDRPLAYWATTIPYAVIAIEPTTPRAPHTIGTIEVNGVKLRAMFDTGAATSLLDRTAAARLGFRPDGPGVVPAGWSGGIGRRTVQTWIAPFDQLKIGDEQINRIHLRVGELGAGRAEMLLGADFFLSHRVLVAGSQHRLYLTYNGGPVFNLSRQAEPPAATASDAEPADAEGYRRRGAARAARLDFAGGIADLDRAVALAPAEPHYLLERARMHAGNHQPALARADLDAAIALKPDLADARLVRAELRIAAHEPEQARGDLDAAAQALGPADDEQLALGGLYEAAGLPALAIGPYTAWIAAHRVDGRLVRALNARCWARALANRELDGALADCNAALRLRPRDPELLDSRGLVYLRRGEDERALADYAAALALAPRQAWSLYGRGLIELRRGDPAKGSADLAAATALQPGLPDRARRYGIGPAG